MKRRKVFYLILFLLVLSVMPLSSATKKSSKSGSSSSQSQPEPVRVVLKFLEEYITGDNNYIENSKLVTDKFKAKYFREVAKAFEEDGILDYVPIVGGQDPAENYRLDSYNPETGIVIVNSVYPEFVASDKIKLKVKKINGKWFVDDYEQR